MKKNKLYSIIIIILILITIIAVSIYTTQQDVEESDELIFKPRSKWERIPESWNQTKSDLFFVGFLFDLYIQSQLELDYLEENEYLLGDRIVEILVSIVDKIPELTVLPDKVIVTPPSGKTQEFDFFLGWIVNGGVTTKSIYLNETGIWRIRIKFSHTYENGFFEGEPDSFLLKNDKEISWFREYFTINVYSNSEYQQLRTAKALEQSAIESKKSAELSRWSTIALLIASISAVLTIIFYLMKYQIDKKEKIRELRAECKIKISESLLELKGIINEISSWCLLESTIAPGSFTTKDAKRYGEISKKLVDFHQKFLQNLSYISTFSNIDDIIKNLNEINERYKEFYREAYLKKLSKKISEKDIASVTNKLNNLENLINNFLFMKIT